MESSFKNKNKNLKIEKKKTNINEELYNLIDKEINSLTYEEALKYDKRSYIQYYLSLLKTKHLLIFSFITKDDYNSREIKISLFFLYFALLYSVNSFFFQEKKINKIYEEKGSYDLINQIPQLFYSTFICILINFLLKYLCLSDHNIIDLKNNRNIQDFNQIAKCLIIKSIIFYILDFSFLLLFWYYLGCFCAVFKNTQFYLIKDILLSFGISLIYPFLLNFLPGIFRIPSLQNLKKNKKCLYNVSKIVQLI